MTWTKKWFWRIVLMQVLVKIAGPRSKYKRRKSNVNKKHKQQGVKQDNQLATFVLSRKAIVQKQDRQLVGLEAEQATS